MGASEQTLVGLKMMELPDPEMVQAVKESLHGTQSRYQGMYTFSSSGKTMPIKLEYHPILSESGSVSGGIGILEDITEQYKTNRKLRESEQRYRSIFENKHTVMLMIDPEDGAIRDANPAAVQFYGWTYEEITEMKISDINTLTPEEIKDEMDRARRSNKNVFHFRHRLADGVVRDVQVFSGIVEIENKMWLYSIVHDITERLEAERGLLKFKLGIDRSPNIVFITNKEGEFQYINPAFEKLYGYSFSELVGKTPRFLKSGKHDLKFYKLFWETILSGEVMEGEVVNRSKDGELYDIKYSSNPIIDDTGNLLGFLAIQQDITEQKRKEEYIKKSLEEKEVLLAEIHHRVKNNLAVVSSLMMLQAMQEEDDSLKEKLNNSVNRIKTIGNVHELLYKSESFSRIRFDENIKNIVDDIAATYRKVLPLEKIFNVQQFDLNINQAIPASLITNEVVTNVFKHAFKKNERGKLWVTLSETNGAVVLQIADNGKGLPADFKSATTDNTLGHQLINTLTQQLGGSYDYDHYDGRTHFKLTFNKKDIKGTGSHSIQ